MTTLRFSNVFKRNTLRGTTGLALFCFLLPFFTVSCPGFEQTLSGTDLLTGTQIEDSAVPPQGLAALVGLCVLAALLISFTPGSPVELAAVFAGLGALGAIALAAKVHRSIERLTDGILQVHAGSGFWLCFLSLVAGAAVGLSALLPFARDPVEPAGAGASRAEETSVGAQAPTLPS